jgi:hypothetical protein
MSDRSMGCVLAEQTERGLRTPRSVDLCRKNLSLNLQQFVDAVPRKVHQSVHRLA